MRTKIPHFLLAATLLAAPSCVGEIEPLPEDELGEPGDDESDIGTIERLGWNRLGWNRLGWNSLTTYPTSAAGMVENPLNSSYYGVAPTDAQQENVQVRAHAAKDVFQVIVECALEPTQSVTLRNPRTGATETFDGQYGFAPKWHHRGIADDPDSREKCSACVATRLNAWGVSILISMLGEDGRGLPLESDPQMRGSGVKASHTDPCSSSFSTDSRCGWDPGWVGTCIPGERVTMKVESGCTGRGAWDSIRICHSPFACNVTATDTRICRTGGKISFTCSADPRHGGTFTVMRRGYYASWTGSARDGVKLRVAAGNASYPASERDVMWFRSSGFFGDMFTLREDPNASDVRTWVFMNGQGITQKWYWTSATGWTTTQPTGAYVAHKNLYACHSPSWDIETNYRLMRVCGGPSGESCSMIWAGNCSSTAAYPGQDPALVTRSGGLCSVEDEPRILGDRDYDNCRPLDRKKRYQHPLTVFLANPCAAAPPNDPNCLDQNNPNNPNNP